jgi:Reverse transcriptase (RNA-dependent DNA polymerase)
LVAQGYTQQTNIDFEFFFTSIPRLESIMMLLTYASRKSFILFQMNIKNDFLNEFLDEEIYIQQLPGFVNQTYPNYIYRLIKALYNLK